jgi:hypothetical protein
MVTSAQSRRDASGELQSLRALSRNRRIRSVDNRTALSRFGQVVPDAHVRAPAAIAARLSRSL